MSKLLDEIYNEITPLEFYECKIRMSIPVMIEHHISKNNLTKYEFAKLINISKTKMDKYLSGCFNFDVITLSKIAFLLNIEVRDLFQNITETNDN